MNIEKSQDMLVKEFSKRFLHLPSLQSKGIQKTISVDISDKFSLVEVSYGNWWYQYFSYKLFDKITGKELAHLILHLEESETDGKEESFLRFLQYDDGNVVQDRVAKSYTAISESLILDKVVRCIPVHLVSAFLNGFKEIDERRMYVK